MNVNYSDPKVAAEIREKNFRKIDPYANATAAAIAGMRRNSPEIILFDTTGRDGMQTHKAFANPSIPRMESKRMVIERIAQWGIPAIEIGYPGASAEEFEAARKIVKMIKDSGLPTTLVGLAGTKTEHIKAAIDAGLDEVHIFSSGSIPHAWTKFRRMPHELISGDDHVMGVVPAVEYAVAQGAKKILVSLEDAYSADPDHLVEVAHRISDAAKSRQIRYNIPDTISVADPMRAFALIAYVRKRTYIPIDVHFHNDGNAAAVNSAYAVAAGATRVHTTVNGLGERGGNASVSRLLIQLYQHYGIIPRDVFGDPLDLSQMRGISKFVEGLSGIKVPANEPGTGDDAYVHISGIHADGYNKSKKQGAEHSIYVPVNPQIYGNEERVETGPLAGKANHVYKLAKFGIDVEHPEVKDRIDEIALSDKKLSSSKHVSDAEYLLNAYEIIERMPCEALKVEGINVAVERISNSGGGARAKVVVELDGEWITSKGVGNGPVDAAVDAIKHAIGKDVLKILHYDNHSIGTGSDAPAEVELMVQDGGSPIGTSFIGPNTTLIAVDAYVQAYNAVRALERLRHKYPAKETQSA